MKNLKRLIPLILSVTLDQYVSAQGDTLRVSTLQGDVLGTFSAPSVRQFVGIPFASAERWEAPTLPSKRKEVFDASMFDDSCLQMLTPANVEFNLLAWTFGREEDVFVPQSEDCLTVNIWSPSINRKQNTAVMVWIYGGGLNWGTSRLPIYNGTNLVRDNDDVTIVSFNYRLNIFGFPNSPQLDKEGKSQNFGFLDVDAAVQWVHDNIAGFGGDPDRITLFGQSAGAFAIDAYAFAHPNDTRVKGLIQQSGNILLAQEVVANFNLTNLPRINSTTWNAAAAAVGCGDVPTSSQFSCMQNVSAQTLEEAVINNNVAFNPVVDEITYVRDPQALAEAGKFLHVPLLVGNNQNEDDVFAVATGIVSFGEVIPVLEEIISDITNIIYACPAAIGLAAHVSAGLESFRYLYQPVFPGISLRPDLRAFHGSEIPIIFGTYNQSPIAPTPTEISFARSMQSVWVGFARNPEQGLIDLGWPKYNPNTASLAQLGNPANVTGVVFTKSDLVDILCQNTTFLVDVLGSFSALQALGAN